MANLRFPCLLIVCLMFIAQTVYADRSITKSAANRIALVIGNSAYKSSPLKNPVNDAADIGAALRSAGFTITL
jgi:hypothetical protein